MGYIFNVPHNIAADKEVTVSVGFPETPYDLSYPAIRIYLATAPPGWGTGPVCWLVNSTSIEREQVAVTIPASAVAGDGNDLMLAYSFLDEHGVSTRSWSYSNTFDVSGGSSDWTALELNGYTISAPDYVPCTAYQCTRDCSSQYYPDGDIALTNDDGVLDATYKAWYQCLKSCPGTTYDSYGWQGDDDGEGDDDDDNDASLNGTPTATATDASAHATSPSASATATSKETSTSRDTSTVAASNTRETPTDTATSTSRAGRTTVATTGLLMGCVGMVALWL